MQCNTCTKEVENAEIFFCYWCGQTVCAACVWHISLPLDTKATVCPACGSKSGKNEVADESMWEIVVNATLSGHDLSAWELTEQKDGWQVRCRTCDKTAWVGMSSLQYSLLADSCLQTES